MFGKISPDSSVVDYKFFVDTRNIWGYNFNKYKDQPNSPYNILLINPGTDFVEGIFRIEKSNIPSGIFISSSNENDINLDDAIQLELKSIEIPIQWITKSNLEKIFLVLQLSIGVYLEEKIVILWFNFNEHFYMCRIRYELGNKHFNYFRFYMSDLLYPILMEEQKH